MADDSKTTKKRSRAASDENSVEAQFPGPHAEDCKCDECVAARKEKERAEKQAEERKKAALKEGRIRRFYGRMAKLRVGARSFWEGLHDVLGGAMSFITVAAMAVCLWLLISRLWAGEWIVPCVSLAALVVIGRVNERLG